MAFLLGKTCYYSNQVWKCKNWRKKKGTDNFECASGKWNSVQQTTNIIILLSMLTGGKKMAALQQSK